MSTFEASRDLFNQYHFTVVEIDLPIVDGPIDLTGSVEAAGPQWYWRLDEIAGIVATDAMANDNLEYESGANTADYTIATSQADGLGLAKDINGDSALQIFDSSATGSAATSLEESITEDNPEHYWKLDENSASTTAVDEMGNGNLTYEAASNTSSYSITSSTADGVGFAKNIEPASRAIRAAALSTGILTTSDFTIELAFRIISAQTGAILIARKDASFSRFDWIIKLDSSDSDIMVMDFHASGNGTPKFTANIIPSLSSASADAGTGWHWLSIRMDYTGALIFDTKVDNVEQSNVDVTTWDGDWDSGDSDTFFTIGEDSGGAGNKWDEDVDEVVVFLEAITDVQRTKHYDWWFADENVVAETGSLTTADFTIECAFAISSAGVDMHLLGKVDNTIEYAIRLDSVSTNILVLDLFQSDDTDRESVMSADLSTDGVTANDAWHWLSIRMDDTTTSLLTCEIDGVETASIDVSTWSGNWRQDILSRFAIGADGETGSNIWNGFVDEVAIYLKAITTAERDANYSWWSADTSGGVDITGFGTPFSSTDASTGTFTYKFTTSDAPALDETGILRIIDAIIETTAKLNPQAGLASRGSGSVTMIDIKGDPNTYAPAVTPDVIATGTFLAKLNARNIVVNKPLRIKNYRMESDGSIDLTNGAQTRHYIIESFDSLGNDKWALKFKDELSRVNISESVWPLPLEGSVRTAVNNSTTTIPVDANVSYVVGDTVRIGDELMKVSGVSGIGTGAATLTVGGRGNDIVYTNTLSKTVADSHEVDDEVYVCEVSDNEDIDVLLKRILVDIGIDASFIVDADWAAEIADWHPTDKINTLWIESVDTSEVLKKILGDFLLDMWFDPVDQEIKLTAISQWRESSDTITEGNEIEYDTVKRKKEERLRYTRGLVVYDKRFLASSDTVENFNKAALFSRPDLEVSDLYGEPKTKRFDFSSLLTKNSAALLVNRFVSRNENPLSYKWITQERKLNFNVGDVLNLVTDADVGFDGSRASGTRAQITEIRPKYTRLGREYAVSALSYLAAAEDGTEFIVSGNVRNFNIHTYIGAPIADVEVTIVFDAAFVGGTDTFIPAVIAGNFSSGSKIIMILANGADLQAKGGKGGQGQPIIYLDDGGPQTFGIIGTGFEGGIAYDAQGVDTDIYFSGATTSTAFATADGSIRAPNGGDGGFQAISTKAGDGGDGGDGVNGGIGGNAGPVIGDGVGDPIPGNPGAAGGVPTSWGQVGTANDGTGGPAGSGVIDNGATVTFFGDDAARYVNGNGDH